VSLWSTFRHEVFFLYAWFDLYSGGIKFETWPWQRLFWLRIFVVSLSLEANDCVIPWHKPCPLPPKSFQFQWYHYTKNKLVYIVLKCDDSSFFFITYAIPQRGWLFSSKKYNNLVSSWIFLVEQDIKITGKALVCALKFSARLDQELSQ
jgi:hypothetical protein